MNDNLSKPPEDWPTADTSIPTTDTASTTSPTDDRAGKPKTSRSAEVPPPIDGDLVTQLPAIEQQKRALETNKTEVRNAMWDAASAASKLRCSRSPRSGHSFDRLQRSSLTLLRDFPTMSAFKHPTPQVSRPAPLQQVSRVLVTSRQRPPHSGPRTSQIARHVGTTRRGRIAAAAIGQAGKR